MTNEQDDQGAPGSENGLAYRTESVEGSEVQAGAYEVDRMDAYPLELEFRLEFEDPQAAHRFKDALGALASGEAPDDQLRAMANNMRDALSRAMDAACW